MNAYEIIVCGGLIVMIIVFGWIGTKLESWELKKAHEKERKEWEFYEQLRQVEKQKLHRHIKQATKVE